MKQLIAFLFCLLPMAVLAQVPPYVHNSYDTQAVAQVDTHVATFIQTGGVVNAYFPGNVTIPAQILDGTNLTISIQVYNRVLNDVAGAASLDWKNRILYGTLFTPTLDWQNRQLLGAWTATNLDGLVLNAYDTQAVAQVDARVVSVVSTSTIPNLNVTTLNLVNPFGLTNLSSGSAPSGNVLIADGLGHVTTSGVSPPPSTNNLVIGYWSISSNTNQNYLLMTNGNLGYAGADLLITPDIPDVGLNMAFNSSSASNSSVALVFSIATGAGSFAACGATASGDFSFAAGGTASGNTSFAANNSTASGENSYAVGGGEATGDYSISIGNTAYATNVDTVGIGNNSTAGGVGTVVISANGDQETPDVFTNNNAICLAGIGGFNLKGPFLVTKKSNSLTITNGSNSRAQWVMTLAIHDALGVAGFTVNRPGIYTNNLFPLVTSAFGAAMTNTWTWNVNPDTTNTIVDISTGTGANIAVVDSHLEQ